MSRGSQPSHLDSHLVAGAARGGVRALRLRRRQSRPPQHQPRVNFFFFITLKPRVELYTKSMSLKCEPASEPLHIPVK